MQGGNVSVEAAILLYLTACCFSALRVWTLAAINESR